LQPEGAIRARSKMRSTVSNGTGLSRKARTERRVATASDTSMECPFIGVKWSSVIA
jgi:hypothetical protein